MIYFARASDTPELDSDICHTGYFCDTDDVEKAWKEAADNTWDDFKGTDELFCLWFFMYETDYDEEEYMEVDYDRVDYSKCKMVGRRQFCVPPHAPPCDNGIATMQQHDWDFGAATDAGPGGWHDCMDKYIPCRACKTVMVRRFSKFLINNDSKSVVVRYENDAVLKNAAPMIISKPKNKHKHGKQTRICAVICKWFDEAILIQADTAEAAEANAEHALRDEIENDSDSTMFLAYDVTVAPNGTKLTYEALASDAIGWEYVCGGDVQVPPIGEACFSGKKEHPWSAESFLFREYANGVRDAIRYCTAPKCHVGEITRMYPHETIHQGFWEFCRRDVEYKDGLAAKPSHATRE